MHAAIPTRFLLALAILLPGTGCTAEPAQGGAAPAQAAARELRPVPGCEGCEAAWERDPGTMRPEIALATKAEPGEPLLLTGTVYRPDGKTPASNVVVYVHHANAAGRYAGGGSESEWSRRHGRLRGWLKTDADGRYQVRTIKPGPYPDRPDPAHIHLTVLEEGKDPYYIDDVVFAGERGVDAAYVADRENRGGPGVVGLRRNADGRWLAQRDIILLR